MDATGPSRGRMRDRGSQHNPQPNGHPASDAATMGSDVTFCAVERVAGQVFVCIATTAHQGWCIYKVTKFASAPVQVERKSLGRRYVCRGRV